MLRFLVLVHSVVVHFLICLFVCLFVWFMDSGSRRSAALLGEEPTLPEALGLKGGQTRPLLCAGCRPLPWKLGKLVGRQGAFCFNFRALAGRRMICGLPVFDTRGGRVFGCLMFFGVPLLFGLRFVAESEVFL